MPHVTLDLSPGGPIIDIDVGVSEPRAAALKIAGLPVPPKLPIRALIDTGASMCALDPSIIKQLKLVATGVTPISTVSTEEKLHDAQTFDVSLVLMHPKLALRLDAVPVISASLVRGGIHALLGRDVLANCLFFYNGDVGRFALAV